MNLEMPMTQRLSILAVSALLGALAMPAVAQTAGATMESSPGKATLRHERQIVATVEEVDAAKRTVTLKGPKGNVVPLTVGPEVRNLAQVKVGDKVRVRYAEALSLTLKKDGKELPSAKAASEMMRAPAGGTPARASF